MPGLRALMEAVRWQESSNDYQQDGNPNFKGAYQFGTAAFISTGYKNEEGSWTGKNGINNMDDWLAETAENPNIERIQDGAFLEWLVYLWSKIRAQDTEPLAGQTLNGVDLTVSGMILGSHLIGETRFQERYIMSGGTTIPTDSDGTTGTPVTQYI
jgi:hypothetical protein